MVDRNQTNPQKSIDIFENPAPKNNYWIDIESPEFTCLCPVTGQPDFATIRLSYVPDQKCVELKSYKLYLWSFRDEGKFHEAVTNEIADYLNETLKPRCIKLEAEFKVRGGIYTTVKVAHGSPKDFE